MTSQSHLLAALRRDCHILLIDSLDFASGGEEKKRKKHPSTDGQTLASPGSHFGNRVKVLPQQFQDVVRVIVSGTAHPAQLHGLQVGVRWDVGGRAVELVQCEPQGVWVHLDQVSENTAKVKVNGVTAREWIASPVT